MRDLRAALVVVAVAVAAGAACNNEGPRDPTKGADGRLDASVPSAPAASSASSAGRCATDADCRTWASYCPDAPCACRALGKDEGEPQCSSPSKVACLVDPCMSNAAACQSGRCELVPEPTKK